MQEDEKKLDYGVHLLSGTPGRVYDMIMRKKLLTDKLKIVVLDEADVILMKGFRDQIYDIWHHFPHDIQVILVSATMPPDVLELAGKLLNKPVKILVKRDEISLEAIK